MGIFAPEGEEVTAGWTIINISLHQIPLKNQGGGLGACHVHVVGNG